MNNVQIVGNLTRDVEYSKTSTGNGYAKFALAVQRKYKSRDGERDTDFIDCVAWGKCAELCDKYLAKGSKIGIVGSIQVNNYTDQDGNNRKFVNVVVAEIEFLSSNNVVKGKSSNRSYSQPTQQSMEEYEDSDTLPF